MCHSDAANVGIAEKAGAVFSLLNSQSRRVV